MKIKEICLSERPRERMLSAGPSALSNGELLALILRNGTAQMNVLELSRHLLNLSKGSLVGLSRLSLEQLCQIKGIKEDKACILLAVFELGRRFIAEGQERDIPTISNSKDAYKLLLPLLKGMAHEEAWIIILDSSYKVITLQATGIGNSESVIIEAKEIVKTVLENRGSALILAHNHPSGNSLPSEADIKMTDNLNKACELLNIRLLDHIIICDEEYYSFADSSTVKCSFKNTGCS